MDAMGFTTGYVLGSSSNNNQKTQTCECVCPEAPPREPMTREDGVVALGIVLIIGGALFAFNRWMNSGIEK